MSRARHGNHPVRDPLPVIGDPPVLMCRLARALARVAALLPVMTAAQ
jgi:hypothetical protein